MQGTRLMSSLALASLLAGCLDHRGAPIPQQLDDSAQIRGDACVGVEGVMLWPATTEPSGSEVPPGWGTPVSDSRGYWLEVYQCQRLKVGPFERPVTILTESHDNANFPQQCIGFDKDLDRIEILVALWVNDTAVADYLTNVEGIPTHYATFQAVNDTTLPVPQPGWTWKVPGMNASSLYLPYAHGDYPVSHYDARLMYHNETTVSALDLFQASRITSDQTYHGHIYGIMEAPTLEAQGGYHEFAGTGDVWVDGYLEAKIQHFKDMQCKEPA